MLIMRRSPRKQKLFLKSMPMVLVCLLLAQFPGAAQAATKMLMINPVRMIFTDRQRSITANVINTSQESITYKLSLVTMRKGANGKLYKPETETEEEQMVKKMIRFAPRRATIEAGKRQVVKLMVRKPRELPRGEYQTRLRLTPLSSDKSSSAKVDNSERTGTAIDLDIIVESTFPIIIQHGGLTADVAPQAIAVKDFPQAPAGIAAVVSFSRSGDGSAFGNVFLRFIPNDRPGDSREIGRSQGLAIYLPDTEKTVTIPLTGISRQELSTGTVRVEYQPGTGIVTRRKQKHGSQRVARDFAM